MNAIRLSLRAAMVAGTLIGALALPAISQAGSVTVNSAQVCIDTPNISMDPSGNLVLTCTPVGNQPPPLPGVPACSIVSKTVTAAPGLMTTMSASCTNSPTAFTWTGTAPGFVNTNAASVTVGPLESAGTYTFTVYASNGSGPGNTAAGTLTVAPASTGGGGGTGGTSGCTATAQVVANFTGLTWVELNIDRTGAVAVAMPINTPGMITELRSIQSTSTSTTLTDMISISTCPGDFNVAPECVTWGTVFGSATYLRAWTNPPTDGICSMTPGVQYYANVKNVLFDRVTPACTTATCNMKLQYNAY